MSETQEMAAGGCTTSGDGVEECWMDFDGARMRYLKTGSGPRVDFAARAAGVFVFVEVYATRAGALCHGLRSRLAGSGIFRSAKSDRAFDAGDRFARAEICGKSGSDIV